MLRIVYLSDTHNMHSNIDVPEGDILIHGGDFSNYGYQHEVEAFMKWWMSQKHSYKILIAGNHDITFDNRTFGTNLQMRPFWLNYLLSQYTRFESLNFYLEHSSCNIWGINFFGSPYCPKTRPGQSSRWGFSEEREDLGKFWVDIPNNTDVLITHSPPYGKLDWCMSSLNNGRIGCERLRYHVNRVKPKLHLFGHIHEDYGMVHNKDTMFINGSIFTHTGGDLNMPQVIDIDEVTKEVKYVHSFPPDENLDLINLIL